MKHFNCTLKILKILISALSVVSLCACGSLPGRPADTSTEFVLDTFCTVTVSAIDSKISKGIISGAFDTARKIQRNIDFYDEASTVSKFNSAGAGEAVALDDDTFNIVSLALEISESSGGAFDITIAPVSELWDFKSDNPQPPDSGAVKSALAHVGFQKLILDSANRTLTKTEDGVKIDLGSCGKGYACEKIMDEIKTAYPKAYVIIDFGGNIGVCGSNPKHSDGHTTVGIQEPFKDSGIYNRTIDLYSGQSAVTSGTYQRHFYYNNINYHHLLDPMTGYPADNGIDSVTVTASSSLLADCLSTACFILGEDEGSALAHKYGAETYWIKQ